MIKILLAFCTYLTLISSCSTSVVDKSNQIVSNKNKIKISPKKEQGLYDYEQIVINNKGTQISIRGKMIDCSEAQNKCKKRIDETPTLCVSTGYKNNIFLDDEAYYGWGQSECNAKKNLAESFCRNQKDPQKATNITCIPDPSGGECPIQRTMCPQVNAPALCVARRYFSYPLRWLQAPKASASNECEARQLLKIKSCNMHLQPSGLSDIYCVKFNVSKECENTYNSTCKDYSNGNWTTCTINPTEPKLPSEPITASASSECLARKKIREIACLSPNPKRSQKPAERTTVHCDSVQN
ncbi:MAG: hypothetical protein CMP10_06545 [Zetaproteobacteria bacterium]|nr:hypothetical protein [Pseudobdellovibrionaceae bacterium]